jgi:hypothetical protein
MFLISRDAALLQKHERKSSRVVKEAIEFHIDGLRKHGDPIPPPSSEGQFVDTDAA